MARRTSDRMSAATSSSADGIVDDEGALRESWLYRSTLCVGEEKDNEDDDDNDVGACGWSPLYTPTPCNVVAKAGTGGEAHMTIGFEARAEVEMDVSSNACPRKGRRRLPLISGFSNSEALRAQLPRNTSKQAQITQCDAISKAKGLSKINSNFEQATDTASNSLLPSIDDVEANRRKWDLERKLQDANRSGHSVNVVGIPERKPDLRRKLQILNPIFPSVVEVEANQRKWDLERKLQDADRIGVAVDETNAPEQKPSFKRKLQTLNPCGMKMNPVVPSATEVEANRRKWDLERRLQDAKGFNGAGNKADAPQQKRDLRRKLQSLNPFVVNPITPSAAEVEENRRKWDRERQLQDADRISMAVTISDARGRKCDSAQKLPRLKLVASSVSGQGSSMKKWALESSLSNMEDRLELKLQMSESDGTGRKREPEAFPRSGRFAMNRERHEFEMSEALVYLLLFSSTAVLHCAIFNFNFELRRFLRLDIYPFGVLLLLSWTFVGLIHFAGGLVGDLIQNRVMLLRRTAVIWGVAVVAFHVAAFDLSPAVSSMSLVSGLLFAGVAHGIVCPNVIALRVETKLCSFETMPTPLSPEEDEEISSSEDDSAAESEASYLSDVSTANSDDQHQKYDLASHNFFSGCFAATLAGSSVVQGYYFLLVDVDALTDEGSLMTVTSRGFHCMLCMSFTLMASLVFFSFQSWGYRPSCKLPVESTVCGNVDDQRFQNKLAGLEREFTTSADTVLAWSWEKLVHLCNRALVGYALLAFVLMALIGVGFSLVVVLLASQTSLSVRLVAFMLIVVGWLLTMIASSRQLNPTKKKLLRECRRFGLRSRQLYSAIFAAAFVCVSGCVSFLRAQLYTTLVVQVCQTRLLIPGTTNTLVDPELLGTAVGTASLILLGLARLLTKSPVSVTVDRVESSTPTKANIFAPTTPVLQKTGSRWLSIRLLSFPPVTRMCFAMLLYLVSIFLSSVVELYRRKALVSPSAIPRSCGAVHSEFTFLWTSPYVVMLGASDALFRVSFQEACHDLARGYFALVPSRRWAGAVQGAILLSEALGYTTALSLVAVLSRWLFRPEPTDMALLFLLLTTGVALTHALLNRIAARAQAYQRLYFPVPCHSTQPAK